MASRSISKFGRELRDIILTGGLKYQRRYQEPRADGIRIKFYDLGGDTEKIPEVIKIIKERWPRLIVYDHLSRGSYGNRVVSLIVNVSREKVSK